MSGSGGSDGLGTGALTLINLAWYAVAIPFDWFSTNTGLAIFGSILLGISLIIAAIYDFWILGVRGENVFRVRQGRRQARRPVKMDHRSEHDFEGMVDMPYRMFSKLPSPTPPESP